MKTANDEGADGFRSQTSSLSLFFFFLSLFIYFWLCLIFDVSSFSEWGPFSSYGARASHCGGFSCEAQALGTQTSVDVVNIVALLGLSCPRACGLFPDQGLNQCPLGWQMDSSPLEYWGSPHLISDIILFEFWGKPHIVRRLTSTQENSMSQSDFSCFLSLGITLGGLFSKKSPAIFTLQIQLLVHVAGSSMGYNLSCCPAV